MNADDCEPPGARLAPSLSLWLAAAVVACRLMQVRSFPIYDDAFITYRYAENFASGHGLVFNAGASWEPVLGTTTPLYALLLGILNALGAPVVAASLAFNFLCDFASAWILTRSLAARPVAAVGAVLVFAVSPHTGRISAGGMEAALFVALSLGATALAERGRLAGAGWLAALTCTTRPEGVLLVGALAAWRLRSWRDVARFGAPIALVGLASAGVLTAIYGSPIAQSVRAKAGRHGLGMEWSRGWSTFLQAFAPSLPFQLLAPFTLFGLARAGRRASPLCAFVLFACAIPIAYVVAGAKTWGWYFYAPLTAACVGLGIGVDGANSWLAARGGAWRRLELLRRAALRPAAGAGLALAVVALFTALAPDRVTPGVYQPLRELLERLDLARRSDRLLASDIGAVGYFARTTILDSEGLVWPPARRFASQSDVLEALRPEYFMIVVNRRRMGDFLEHPVHTEYEPFARLNVAGDRELRPELEGLPEVWVQDYIFFRRRDLAERGE